jgi:hypothetical protein
LIIYIIPDSALGVLENLNQPVGIYSLAGCNQAVLVLVAELNLCPDQPLEFPDLMCVGIHLDEIERDSLPHEYPPTDQDGFPQKTSGEGLQMPPFAENVDRQAQARGQ